MIKFYTWIKYISLSPVKKKLFRHVRRLTGLSPVNLDLYKLAFSHTSVVKKDTESNERLEYLGDAVLSLVVAEYLFKKFPYKDEGFLTEIRARIVNRESLNRLGMKIGLRELVEYNQGKQGKHSHKSLYGDALEALVGAIYLDKGFKAAKKFTASRLLSLHIDIDKVIQQNRNFKSILIEWAQKNNRSIKFIIVKEEGHTHLREFTAEVKVDNDSISTGTGLSKKKAEQAAAESACNQLNLSENSI